jgi:hypothetical protein
MFIRAQRFRNIFVAIYATLPSSGNMTLIIMTHIFSIFAQVNITNTTR